MIILIIKANFMVIQINWWLVVYVKVRIGKIIIFKNSLKSKIVYK